MLVHTLYRVLNNYCNYIQNLYSFFVGTMENLLEQPNFNLQSFIASGLFKKAR
jgi:hypothetical protein